MTDTTGTARSFHNTKESGLLPNMVCCCVLFLSTLRSHALSRALKRGRPSRRSLARAGTSLSARQAHAPAQPPRLRLLREDLSDTE